MPKQVKTSVPQRHVQTRSSNKTAHPGNVDKSTLRRSTAEVNEERKARARAKAAREEARQQSINRAAEFERADMADEILVDATPRPLFTPKRPRNQDLSDVTPLPETSDVDMSGNFAKSSSDSEPSDTEDDLNVESDASAPPRLCKKPKGGKNKSKTVKKAVVKTKADPQMVGPSLFFRHLQCNYRAASGVQVKKSKNTHAGQDQCCCKANPGECR
jgi:hypothetical protein